MLPRKRFDLYGIKGRVAEFLDSLGSVNRSEMCSHTKSPMKAMNIEENEERTGAEHELLSHPHERLQSPAQTTTERGLAAVG
jgi:hypothetical protein